MSVRKLVLTALCACVALGAAVPAFADEDWQRPNWQEHHDWQEHQDWQRRQEWRARQEWREREWRIREWRERQFGEQQRREYSRAPSVVVVPGVPTGPGVYDPNPGYYPRNR